MAFEEMTNEEINQPRFDRAVVVGMKGSLLSLVFMGSQEVEQKDLRAAAAFLLNAACLETDMPYVEEMEFIQEQAYLFKETEK